MYEFLFSGYVFSIIILLLEDAFQIKDPFQAYPGKNPRHTELRRMPSNISI
jgi:hypothetical protein